MTTKAGATIYIYMEGYDKSTMPVNAEKYFYLRPTVGFDIYIGRTLFTTCTALANTYISAIRTIFFGVVSIAQSVEVTDSAVLGGVAEVVSSNPSWAIKIFFQHFPA